MSRPRESTNPPRGRAQKPGRKGSQAPAPGAGWVAGGLEDGGEPRVADWVGPVKSVVKAIPVGCAGGLEDGGEPIYPKPVIPTTAELAALPATARAAIIDRYERRAAVSRPELPPGERVRQAVFTLVETATTGHRIGRVLRRLRREFDSVASVAKAENWTDDTPAREDAFGHKWPVVAATPSPSVSPPPPSA